MRRSFHPPPTSPIPPWGAARTCLVSHTRPPLAHVAWTLFAKSRRQFAELIEPRGTSTTILRSRLMSEQGFLFTAYKGS